MGTGTIRKTFELSIVLCMVLPLSSIITRSIPDSEPYASRTPALLPVNESAIIEMIQKVNRTDILHYLEDFVAFGVKPTGSKASNECRDYIFNTFKQMGLDVENQSCAFPYVQAKNVIATQHGTYSLSDAVLILCAHYDSWNNTPGANDDGSGIAALLTIAQIMHKYQFNYTIRYIAFSGHEQGTFGSYAYAKKAYAQHENIIAVLTLDMIGNTTRFCKKIQIHFSERTEWICQYTLNVLEKYQEYLPLVVEPVTDIAGADEKSFFDYGYDAVLFHQPHSWLPEFHNHEPGDNMSAVDVNFLVNVTKLILADTAELGNQLIDPQIRITEPCEGYLYSNYKRKYKLPSVNFYGKKFRGLTYIQGGFLATFNITSTDKIDVVYCIIDGECYFKLTAMNPPYYIIINNSFLRKRSIFPGLHTFRFYITTYLGKTAYDEMDIFLLP